MPPFQITVNCGHETPLHDVLLIASESATDGTMIGLGAHPDAGFLLLAETDAGLRGPQTGAPVPGQLPTEWYALAPEDFALGDWPKSLNGNFADGELSQMERHLEALAAGTNETERRVYELLGYRLDDNYNLVPLTPPVPVCSRCGQPYGDDPEGSPGVLVHVNDDGRVDYDRDRHHVPQPETD